MKNLDHKLTIQVWRQSSNRLLHSIDISVWQRIFRQIRQQIKFQSKDQIQDQIKSNINRRRI